MTKARINKWFGLTMLALAFMLGISLAASSASAGAPATLSKGAAPSQEVHLQMPGAADRDTSGTASGGALRTLLSPGSLGDVLFTYQAGAATGGTSLLGVEYTNIGGVGNYWVTGRDAASAKQLFKFDSAGAFLGATPQDVCGTSTFGWRDLAFDGTNLITADECGVDLVDPATGTRVGGYALPGGVIARAMARNPVNNHCFTTNFNNPIYEFDCSSGVVIAPSPYPANGLANYGFGWDTVSAGGPYIWSWAQQALGGGACVSGQNCIRAARLSPTGAVTGVAFDGVPFGTGNNEIAGGADVDVIGGLLTLVTFHQGSLVIRGYDLTNVGPSSTPTNTPLATATFTPRPPLATPTCLPQLVMVDRNKQKPGTLTAPVKPAKSLNNISSSVAVKSNPGKAEYMAPDASFIFALDDGTAENSIGFGTSTTEAPSLWLNRFTPSGLTLPYSIQNISIFWRTQGANDPTFVTETARLLVYLDANADGDPSDATLLNGPNGQFVQVGAVGAFRTYNINPGVPVTAAGDLYIGFEDFWAEPGNYMPKLSPAAIDQTASQVRSWIIAMGSGASPNITNLGLNDFRGTIDSFGLPGNWLIRATGNDGRPGSCPPTFTPAVSNTPTSTIPPTNTPVPTNTPQSCGENSNYTLTTGTDTLVPGTTLVTGSQDDDAIVPISIPFTYDYYKRGFPSVNASTNGNLQFSDTNAAFANICLPSAATDNLVAVHWDDLDMTTPASCTGGCGIYTSVSGSSPSRVFNIEWRAVLFGTASQVNFEVRLYEGLNRLDMVYGTVTGAGSSATVGIQRRSGLAGNYFVQYECNAGGLTPGLLLTFTQPKCATTPTATPTCPPLARVPQTIGLNNPGKANVVKGNNNGLSKFSSRGLMVKSAPVLDRAANPQSPITLRVDDGSIETAIGFGTSTTETAAIWLNRFSPGSYNLPMTLTQISIYWPPDNLSGGSLMGLNPTLLVYSDADGDNNPANATLLSQIPNATIVITGAFQNYPVSVSVPITAGDVYVGFEDAWAEPPGFTPRRFPAAEDTTDPQVRSWVIAMGSGAAPDRSNLGNNDTLATIDSFGLPGNWMIRANANTADSGCAPAGVINGHVTWQGIPQPNSRNTLVTATLTLCNGGSTAYSNTNLHTDLNGNFSVATGLPNGTYTWKLKGARHLNNGGSLTISGGIATFEAGTEKTGNANTDNLVNSTDFTIFKANFGLPGVDRPSDFDFSGVTNSTDFTLLKSNFGQAGVATTCP